MMKFRIGSAVKYLVLPILILSLTSCENNNLFTKLHGDSNDPKTLTAQALIALRDHNYAEALHLYERVLAQDPNNAEALYGAASAAIGSTGLNFSSLISKILQQVNGSSLSIHGLGDVVSQSREHLSAKGTCGSISSILDGIDCDALLAVMPTALCRIQTIVSGIADGSINPDDSTVLIDLGLMRVLYAALLAQNANFINIENNGGDFDVTAGSVVNNMCDPGSNSDTTTEIIRNVGWAYALFDRVVTLRNLSGDPIIIQIRDDIKVVGDKVMDSGSGLLPAACFNSGGPFDTLGINQSNYLTVLQSGAFTPPSSGC